MKIIGITGKARSGKDTAARFLVEQGWERRAFADPVKQAASEMFGVPLANFYDDDVKEKLDPYWAISPRQMAQKLGTEGGRDVFGYDLWIKRMAVELNAMQEALAETFGPFAGVVIPDVRFDNEAEFIRRRGGRVLRVSRPGAPAVAAHVSEAGISDFLIDCTITNNGSIDALRYEVLRFAGDSK